MMEKKENHSEYLGPKSPNEIQVWIPKRLMAPLDKFCADNGISRSLLLQKVLLNPVDYEVPDALTRPHRFEEPVHRFLLCFRAEQKRLLASRIKLARYEFGPYLRYLLELYIDQLEYLLEETDGQELNYERVFIAASRDRIELFDVGHKWHVYSYEIWSYISPYERSLRFPSKKIQRPLDEFWYNHWLNREMRRRHRDKFEFED